ncbi:hypothetical protein DFH05DRAFT_1521371 [Lentinula detonsa]|uniref:Uncharacterized protein n=1 Tax=Lentinula detonsa TaxID=2804962 RepID=A0A9W8P535_9AGAR|nr:hypothetical protein DFH05DRAFT_1521371 [Lentinula detonsa]
MLFTVTTSRLFTLLYLCVSMLTASGSPLPTDGATGFPPELFRRESELEVRLGRYKSKPGQKPIRHVLLAIGDAMVHASWSDTSKTQLLPEQIPAEHLEYCRDNYDWFPLGKAKFKTPAAKELALKALLSIELPLHKEPGGNCWDYIESALKTLKEHKALPDSASTLKEFKENEEKFRYS